MLPTDGPAGMRVTEMWAAEMWVADAQGLASEDLDLVLEVLIAEFAGQLPAEVVIEHVVIACQLLFAAGVFAGLAPATESMARARLRAVSGRGQAE